jgi:hypothetical protein
MHYILARPKVDGLHPLAQQMADAREFHQKQGDGISPGG